MLACGCEFTPPPVTSLVGLWLVARSGTYHLAERALWELARSMHTVRRSRDVQYDLSDIGIEAGEIFRNTEQKQITLCINWTEQLLYVKIYRS